LVLPGATHTPLLTVPGAPEIAVSVLSASKAWNLAGLKCAAVVTAAPGMAAVVSRFPADTRWRMGHFGVIAAIAAFTAGERWLDQLLLTLDHRRTLLASGPQDRRILADRAPHSCSPPEEPGVPTCQPITLSNSLTHLRKYLREICWLITYPACGRSIGVWQCLPPVSLSPADLIGRAARAAFQEVRDDSAVSSCSTVQTAEISATAAVVNSSSTCHATQFCRRRSG
jgi:hypothetical protein